MADRVGVISKGELLLVEDKSRLMHRFARKQLKISLTESVERIPESLAGYDLQRSDDGRTLTYSYQGDVGDGGIGVLLRDLHEAGLALGDVSTHESSLEDIFVDLVKEEDDSP